MEQMKLRFDDDALKEKLQSLANDMELSLNRLVLKILNSQFDETEKKSLNLLMELAQFKRNTV